MHERQPQTGQWTSRRSETASTLDKLDDALATLERRIGVKRNPGAPAAPSDHDISAILNRQQAISRQNAGHRAQPRPETPRRPQSEASHRGGMGEAQIAAEIASLRDELNREMSSSIAHQFEGLRHELKSLGGQGQQVSPAELTDGFDRITRELGLVASRVDNDGMGALRAEVEELKSHVAALAREDTLRDMAERWTVIEREIGELPNTLGSREDLVTIAERIAEMNTALHALPDSVALDAMEDQVRTLAEAVAQLASQNAAISPEYLDAIEHRLDEITQAIVAVQRNVGNQQLDPAPFERIEARISTLARQVEEQAVPARSDALERKLREVSDRLEAIQQAPAGGVSDEGLSAVTSRLDELVRRFDEETATDGGMPQGAMDSLNARLEDIVGRLDAGRSQAEQSGERMFQSLDARMEELARRIEENERASAAIPGLDHMERRIEEIAQMLSGADAYVAPSGQPIDGNALKGIEDQIAELSQRLSSIQVPALSPEMADLAPRLMTISEQLTEGREDMISAARAAAEEVVRNLPDRGSEADQQALTQLTDDLRSLEELARGADERNERTFEAIHDTLIKIAEHIHGLESSLTSAPAPARAKMPAAEMPAFAEAEAAPVAFGTASADRQAQFESEARFEDTYEEVADAPSMDLADDEPVYADGGWDEPRAYTETTEGPEADIAEPSFSEPEAPQETAAAPQKKGLLGGLRNALSGGAAKSAIAAGEKDGRTEPDLSDEPLEPGSGGPDLAAIMQRVRAERSEGGARTPMPNAGEDDTGKSDFIAAARRAARAAAAEASVLETKDGGKGRKKGKAAASGSSRRRSLLIGAGAILLALLSWPLVKGYLFGGPAESVQMAQIEPSAPASAAIIDAEPAPEVSAADAETAPAGTDASVAAAPEAPAAVTPPRSVEFDAASEELTSSAPAMPVEAEGDAAGEETAVAEAPSDDMTAGEMPADDMEVIEAPADGVSVGDMPGDIGPVALRDAAAEGDPKALFVIGDRLTNGENSDLETAAKFYEVAAEGGYAPAQYRIGNFYEKGLGIERNIDTAKMWYQLAAEQGNVAAMHNLAVLYATEVGGKRDMASAARWFEEAADHGVRDSQVNLGILSARGEGVTQDLNESYKWLALAAQSGDADAQAKRDEVAGFLPPDQLKMARGAVELWKAKPVDPDANEVSVPDEWKTGGETTASTTPEKQMPDAEMKKAVRNIQAILNKAGYDAGPADGIMGARTRDAIIAFQEANGMVPNGEVDKALVEKLLEINKQS